jgi:DNA repair protein RecO (recombination protein O)
MKTIRTQAIVLSRTDYGEADRIITFLTPNEGKIRLMARGVRKVKSKLAGGIELFSTSDVSFIRGRGDIGTLVSTQLIKHYGKIIKDIERVQMGYELIKHLNKATEDSADSDYYDLLEQVFVSLNDKTISLDIVSMWFHAQLLALSGHMPNLTTDLEGNKLTEGAKYNFDFENVSFAGNKSGRFETNHIKAMRLLFSSNNPSQLSGVEGLLENLQIIKPLLSTLQKTYQNF